VAVILHACLRCSATWPCPSQRNGHGACLAPDDCEFICSKCIKHARPSDREANGRPRRAAMGGKIARRLSEAVQGL
jgi:hypothetical protein